MFTYKIIIFSLDLNKKEYGFHLMVYLQNKKASTCQRKLYVLGIEFI